MISQEVMRLQAISVDLNRFELLAYAAECGNASKKMQTPHIYIYIYLYIYIYTHKNLRSDFLHTFILFDKL